MHAKHFWMHRRGRKSSLVCSSQRVMASAFSLVCHTVSFRRMTGPVPDVCIYLLINKTHTPKIQQLDTFLTHNKASRTTFHCKPTPIMYVFNFVIKLKPCRATGSMELPLATHRWNPKCSLSPNCFCSICSSCWASIKETVGVSQQPRTGGPVELKGGRLGGAEGSGAWERLTGLSMEGKWKPRNRKLGRKKASISLARK